MTIIEVVVSISIFVIAMAGFTLLFSKSWQMNSYTLAMGQASADASRGLNLMVVYMRKARQGDDGSYPILSASDNDLVIFSDYDKDGITERLHFYLQNGQIKMGMTKPTGTMPKTYPSGDQETIVLVSDVMNTANDPVFSYYNNNYPADTVNNPMPVSSMNISSVRLIKIFLKVNTDPSKIQKDIETQSFVELRNLNDYQNIQ